MEFWALRSSSPRRSASWMVFLVRSTSLRSRSSESLSLSRVTAARFWESSWLISFALLSWVRSPSFSALIAVTWSLSAVIWAAWALIWLLSAWTTLLLAVLELSRSAVCFL